MGRYVLKRLGYMIITIFIVMTITFFLMQLLPGTPFNNAEKLTDEQLELMESKYDLDEPLSIQYLNYMGNLLQGDLGLSFQHEGRTVWQVLSDRIGPSFLIGGEAVLVGMIVGLLLGMIAALRHNTFFDYGSVFLAVLGMSIPSFVFAAVMQYFIGVKWELLPAALWKGPTYTIMPAIALAVMVVATVARFIRSEMLEVLGQDYVTTARAKGISERSVNIKHVLRNALIPAVTVMGPLVVNVITGTLVIERIFAVPGLGEQFTKSILVDDYSVIMGITLFYSSLFIFVIFVVDILYGILDPRIVVGGGKKDAT